MGAQAHEVGALAGLVAHRMGLSQEDTQRAVQAGELRDVGRVAIPDAILNKPAEELDEEERAFLRSQPAISDSLKKSGSSRVGWRRASTRMTPARSVVRSPR